MSLIDSAFGLGSTILGMFGSHNAMKQQKKLIEDQQKKNDAWYNRRYNEDPTQRASAQALLTRTQDSIKSRNKSIAGTQAVTGATQEATMADKEKNNEAIAQVAAEIAAANDARQDSIEQQYREQDASLQQQLVGLKGQQAQSIATATKEASETAKNVASLLGASKKEETPDLTQQV